MMFDVEAAVWLLRGCGCLLLLGGIVVGAIAAVVVIAMMR
jgi:hypothetical protein